MDVAGSGDAVVELRGVTAREVGATLLSGIDWTVRPGEHWAVLGPNGSGKTTLLSILAGYRLPTSGTATVLGAQLGRIDVRELRTRIGFTSALVRGLARSATTVADFVVSGRHAAIDRFRHHRYEPADVERAHELLTLLGAEALAQRRLATLSTGEQQRVAIARALMARPALLVLDEPAAGLDLGARELLLARLHDLIAAADGTTVILVTHHVEELVPGITHLLLLRDGHAVAQGPVADVLRDDTLSETFAVPLRVTRSNGHWSAHWAG
jgi:iron complex transport system ATP-binding protein